MSDEVQAKLAFYEGRLEVFNRIVTGSYEWQPVTIKYIPKDDGSLREVYVLADEDRFVMSAITEIYTNDFMDEISPYCVSYQEGISVSSIVREIQSKGFYKGYKVDLTKYFDSVPLERIEETISSLYPESSLTKLLLKFYKDDRVIINGKETRRFRSLCQGCSFSGFLSNLILRKLDDELGSLCKVYYRYSDDMILLGDNADEYLAVLYERLQSYGLTINEKKLSAIDGEFTFLGVKISEKYLRWSDSKRSRIKKRIISLSKKYNKGSRIAQKKFIKDIQKYLLREVDGYSYFSQLCTLNTDGYDILWLSEFCKSTIRALYTGNHNFTRNRNKTSDEVLRELGWVNLDFLQFCFRKDLGLYKTMVKSILSKPFTGKTKPISVMDVLQLLPSIKVQDIDLKNHRIIIDGISYRIERGKYDNFKESVSSLWKFARFYPENNPLNTNPRSLTHEEFFSCEDTLKRILILILSVDYEMKGFYENLNGLILLHDWFKSEV